jgi:hypothetical protein
MKSQQASQRNAHLKNGFSHSHDGASVEQVKETAARRFAAADAEAAVIDRHSPRVSMFHRRHGLYRLLKRATKKSFWLPT